MKTHSAKSQRHRGAPPGRATLDAEARVQHLEVECQLLRDRCVELEAMLRTESNERKAAEEEADGLRLDVRKLEEVIELGAVNRVAKRVAEDDLL